MSLKSNLLFKKSKFWNKYKKKGCTLWIKGYCNYSVEELIQNLSSIKKNKLENFISSITGNYGIVFSSSKRVLIIVDKIGSSPLNYFKQNSEIFVSPDLFKLKKEFKGKLKFDKKALLQIHMGGFTIGERTLYSEIKTPLAGHYTLFENNNASTKQYYDYSGKIDFISTERQLIQELSNKTLLIFQNTLKRIGNKQIIIPLSAGYDSRLVASCLKHLGAKNVLCYSYGRKNNFEAKTAKKIAEKLGYKWVFIPLIHKSERKFYKSNLFKDYLRFSESNLSVSYFQGLSSIYYLKKKSLIQNDAHFINGNSGDFISGSHINSLFEPNQNLKKRKDLVATLKKKYIEKHFSLWGYKKTPNNIELIEKEIDKIIQESKHEITSTNLHLVYEKLELIDRQSKYVIAGQKTYEFLGYQWMIPLWDDIYLDFWKKIPVNYKYRQELYTKMLLNNNWGGVWDGSIPINEKVISSLTIKILRFIFKIPFGIFGPLGKKNWKNFDKIFFYYWRDDTLMMKSISYMKVIRYYFKNPRNHVSFQTEEFIEKL
jgi:asparagine synthase (glutamine-hydrolysing)